MLKHVNKIIFLVSLIVFSCRNNDARRQLFYARSVKKATESEYYKVYNNALDSIRFWTQNKFLNYTMQINCKWELDSLICFNSKLTKCILSIENQEIRYFTNSINYLYGIKIKSEWYFIEGPTIYLFSERYGQSPKTALSFEKLHAIALDEIYKNYLTASGEINEDFFSDLTSAAYCSECKTDEEFNEIYLGIVRGNWLRRDTTQPIKHLEKHLP